MTKDQGKAAILREYERWKASRGDNLPASAYDRAFDFFHLYLTDRKDLLAWRTKSGDQWQDVQGWIKRHEGYGRH